MESERKQYELLLGAIDMAFQKGVYNRADAKAITLAEMEVTALLDSDIKGLMARAVKRITQAPELEEPAIVRAHKPAPEPTEPAADPEQEKPAPREEKTKPLPPPRTQPRIK